MRLEKETSLYKKESIKKEFEKVDEQVTAAAKTADNFMTADGAGIMIADRRNGENQAPSNPTGRNVLIDNDSVDVRDGKKVLASFGEETVIGEEESFHNRIKSDSYAIMNGDDRLFEVETDGTFTSVYMGGSTKAAGVSYSNAFVESVYNYLSNSCSVVFEDDVYIIYSPEGEQTGYTLDEPITTSTWKYANVLDSSGGTFGSGKYKGIWYILESYDEFPAERFQLNWKINPASEIPNAPGIMSFGATSIMARDGIMDIDASGGFGINGQNLIYVQGENFNEGFAGLGGFVTNGRRNIVTYIPMPFVQGTIELSDVDIVVRHAEGGYPYYYDGSTYKMLGDTRQSLMADGTLASGVTSITADTPSRGGFSLTIAFDTQLCKTNSNASPLTNNTPMGIAIYIQGEVV